MSQICAVLLVCMLAVMELYHLAGPLLLLMCNFIYLSLHARAMILMIMHIVTRRL
jgi:hypothetical protein